MRPFDCQSPPGSIVFEASLAVSGHTGTWREHHTECTGTQSQQHKGGHGWEKVGRERGMDESCWPWQPWRAQGGAGEALLPQERLVCSMVGVFHGVFHVSVTLMGTSRV